MSEDDLDRIPIASVSSYGPAAQSRGGLQKTKSAAGKGASHDPAIGGASIRQRS